METRRGDCLEDREDKAPTEATRRPRPQWQHLIRSCGRPQCRVQHPLHLCADLKYFTINPVNVTSSKVFIVRDDH